MDSKRRALEENPFFVLGLLPEAPRDEVERTAQKLLGMLELGAASVKVYHTPCGPKERTADLVREAVARLRDGAVRLEAEIWAQAFFYSEPMTETSVPDHEAWSDAFRSAGFSR
jgi:hypothetical protein